MSETDVKLAKIEAAWHILAAIFLIWILVPMAAGIIIQFRDREIKEAPRPEFQPVTLHLDFSTPTPIITNSPTPTPFILPWEIQYDDSLTLEEKQEEIVRCNYLLDLLDFYIDTEPTAFDEAVRITAIRGQQLEDIEEYEIMQNEQPIATEIYFYLTDTMGLNDVCAAGIIGNIMVEAGGHSLYINPRAYNSAGYYGICQWSTSYHWRINGGDLQQQLEYLNETMVQEFRYGSATYDQFINATNARDASVYFARGYERCARPYERQSCADIAYEYFCGGATER